MPTAWLAPRAYDREELITAEIDLEKIIAAKATHDTTGHYTRPDLLHLLLQRDSNQGLQE